jgi:hypothetical protein
MIGNLDSKHWLHMALLFGWLVMCIACGENSGASDSPDRLRSTPPDPSTETAGRTPKTAALDYHPRTPEDRQEPGTIEVPPSSTQAPQNRWVIVAVGDLLFHGRLQRQAYGHADGFRSVFADYKDVLSEADITYGNLEGTIATGLTRTGPTPRDPGLKFDGRVYTGYPTFNYHARLGTDLAHLGFDVLSTANNHSLDRKHAGLLATLKALHSEGLRTTGTRSGSDEPWHALVELPGLRVAFLACTERSNIASKKPESLLRCGKGAKVAHLIQGLSDDPKIDLVIVTPHWGQEFSSQPNSMQEELAQMWVNAGAQIVVGSHPHVLQPGRWIRNTKGARAYVAYSLGNFCSGMDRINRRLTVALELHVERGSDGRVALQEVRPIPGRMHLSSQPYRVERLDSAGHELKLRTEILGLFKDVH